jgi:hypothetical protein
LTCRACAKYVAGEIGDKSDEANIDAFDDLEGLLLLPEWQAKKTSAYTSNRKLNISFHLVLS